MWAVCYRTWSFWLDRHGKLSSFVCAGSGDLTQADLVEGASVHLYQGLPAALDHQHLPRVGWTFPSRSKG